MCIKNNSFLFLFFCARRMTLCIFGDGSANECANIIFLFIKNIALAVNLYFIIFMRLCKWNEYFCNFVYCIHICTYITCWSLAILGNITYIQFIFYLKQNVSMINFEIKYMLQSFFRYGSGSSQASQNSGDICRICHCESDPHNPLLTPCYCSGSLKFVHQTCLQQWLTASETNSCELCKFPFIMHTKIKPFNEV